MVSTVCINLRTIYLVVATRPMPLFFGDGGLNAYTVIKFGVMLYVDITIECTM